MLGLDLDSIWEWMPQRFCIKWHQMGKKLVNKRYRSLLIPSFNKTRTLLFKMQAILILLSMASSLSQMISSQLIRVTPIRKSFLLCSRLLDRILKRNVSTTTQELPRITRLRLTTYSYKDAMFWTPSTQLIWQCQGFGSWLLSDGGSIPLSTESNIPCIYRKHWLSFLFAKSLRP